MLELPSRAAQACGINRIFAGALARERYRGTPARIPDRWVGPACGRALVQPSAKGRKRHRFRATTEIPACVLNRSLRPPECLLAGGKFLRQTHRRKSRQRNCSARYAPSAIDDLKAESIRNGVAL